MFTNIGHLCFFISELPVYTVAGFLTGVFEADLFNNMIKH